MQKAKNLSKNLTLFFLWFVLEGCSLNTPTPDVVSVDTYKDIQRCWTNSRGRFSAFMALSKSEQGYVPHLISAKCVVVGEGDRPGVDVLDQLGVMMVTGDAGLLARKGLLDAPLLSNTSPHQGIPSQADKIYYFVGHVTPLTARVYRISEADQLKEFPFRLLTLLDKTPQQRMDLAVEADPGLGR